MPLKSYGVLKCRAIDREIEQEKSSPHYQVHVKDRTQEYRIAINVRSVQAPFDLLYFINDNFQHPITAGLSQLDLGFHEVPHKPGSLALDYIRGNLFDASQMKPLPFNIPGPSNDLNELIELYIQRAIASEEATIYAFGERWGPENKSDKIFGFSPGNGIHDIHMNQGSAGNFQKDNGVWQDGGLLIEFPERQQWVAAFFAFQSQAFHTDDTTGHPITKSGRPTSVKVPSTKVKVAEPDGKVRIVAALVNPVGDDTGKQSVTLINASPDRVDLNGWAIADRLKNKDVLQEIELEAGASVMIALRDKVQLGNNGGIITLLDANGLKVDGVSYTKDEAANSGWTIVF